MNSEVRQQFHTPRQKQEIFEELAVYFLGHIRFQKSRELILYALSFYPLYKILQVEIRQEMLGVAN
jgi:hypothetical protein